ncbi:MAG: hypothetical protein E7568_02395 [Ruminococcaceae bacterium]|nr:hypothetical protein [Oscillospiraceae bacterium]
MKKIISIFLAICLTVIPLNAYAIDSTDSEYSTDNQTVVATDIIEQEMSDVTIDDELITITPNADSPEEQAKQKILAHMKDKGIPVDTKGEATGLISGGIYYIKNYFSGKYLNVHYGVDANGTNVYQWTKDNSTEQKFKVVYDSATDSYKLYAMCSSNGNNRVVDVVRNGSPLASGQNVDIWTPVDHTAQRVKITNLIQNIYHIHMQANSQMYFTTNDSLNGTGGGTSSTSAGNVYIRTFDGNLNQQWAFEYIGNSSSTPSTPTGSLQTVNKSYIRGWAWRSDLPNNSINVNIKIFRGSSQLTSVTISADDYSSDLYNTGYGNGYHEFTYYYDLTTMPNCRLTIYAYAISASGDYIQLSNSPIEYYVDNSVTVYCPLVSQPPNSNWCWAACAEMLGKNANPITQKTMYDVVENIKHNSNGTGDRKAVRDGAQFVSNNGATFVALNPITAQQIENLIDNGIAVAVGLGPLKDSTSDIGHEIVIYGYKQVYASNGSIEKYFIYNDPGVGDNRNKLYEHLFDESQATREYQHVVYRTS